VRAAYTAAPAVVNLRLDTVAAPLYDPYGGPMATDLTGETTELLQALIRNQCVNDGTDASGHEKRNAELLQDYLGSAGL
jgi:hypothetical protein